LSAEDGTVNIASCMERQTDRQTNIRMLKEGREPTCWTSWQWITVSSGNGEAM